MTPIAHNIRKITSGHERARLHPEKDPRAAREVAAEVARALSGLDADITAIACWTSPENLILAFAVADASGVPAVQLSEDEGLLYLSWEIPPARVGLVSASAESARQIDVAAEALAGAGHTCVAVAQLTPAEGDRDGLLTARTLGDSER
ncbi:hypothetical protein [Microbacterium sp. SORGH_AS_0862]|uniref:hypothetical protein n=1 Tax=Microbacterium sp. SORGH_AS_0862 TaxID=3041789 RepID=UPI002793A472|nr:hypothetical protein [Microbacterium sp. SORGH_AS_0862]MDQ1205282.1 acyl-CoA synthetase (AMP-forming)/AMP-acid ligase II [Microbacterium sp. SORGH_AS_0862]